MRRLSKPTVNLSELFLNCISTIHCNEKKGRLEGVRETIEDAANEYERNGVNECLYTFQSHATVGEVTSAEMVQLYTEKMARKDSPGRGSYDEIKGAPQFGICPLCGV